MIDVLVSSTCRPHFERTYESFISRVHSIEGFRFVVHVDLPEANAPYLPRLLAFLKRRGIDDVHVNRGAPTFAGAVNHLIGRIRSEFYFHLEDDWLFLKPVDMDAIIKVMREYPVVHQVRFSKEPIARPGPEAMRELEKRGELFLVPGEQTRIGGMDLVQTSIWSLNPHIARTDIVRRCGAIPDGINPENFLCKSYAKWFPSPGLYISGKYGDGPTVRDIGRPHILVRKLRTILTILRDPSMIDKEKRMRERQTSMGRSFTG